MDHATVVGEKMTEQYLLNELDADTREAFEEHFFECHDCAEDVRAGAAFVQQSKVLLAEQAPEQIAIVAQPARALRWSWLRPAFALPVFACLLAIIGYQNFVSPARRANPQVLPWASIQLRTRGANTPRVVTAPGGSFLLLMTIPPDSQYTRYVAELSDSTNAVKWSLVIQAKPTEDTWPIEVPAANRKSGTYTLTVKGITDSGETRVVDSMPLELQVQE